MSDESKRVQVPSTKEMRDWLRDLQIQVNKAQDSDYGTGAIAAILLEAIRKRPDLVDKFLAEAMRPPKDESRGSSAKKERAHG